MKELLQTWYRVGSTSLYRWGYVMVPHFQGRGQIDPWIGAACLGYANFIRDPK